MGITVAVVGAGIMGSAVARSLAQDTNKVIIDSDLDKAIALAEDIDGMSYAELSGAADADLIIVVIPPQIVNTTIKHLIDIVKSGAVIINMATNAITDPGDYVNSKNITVVDTKVIGHSVTIGGGMHGVVIVKTLDESIFNLIRSQLVGFKDVQKGDADLVAEINSIAVTEGLKTAIRISNKMQNDDIPEEWIKAALGSTCAGTIQAFANEELGHFARELVRKIENGEC